MKEPSELVTHIGCSVVSLTQCRFKEFVGLSMIFHGFADVTARDLDVSEGADRVSRPRMQ